MAEGTKKYSYIRYPYSRNGWYSLALAGVSFLITAAVLILSVVRNGGTTLFLAACGFTALVMSLMGLWFFFLALGEHEKNDLFAFIGGGLSLVLAVIWAWMIINGSRMG